MPLSEWGGHPGTGRVYQGHENEGRIPSRLPDKDDPELTLSPEDLPTEHRAPLST